VLVSKAIEELYKKAEFCATKGDWKDKSIEKPTIPTEKEKEEKKENNAQAKSRTKRYGPPHKGKKETQYGDKKKALSQVEKIPLGIS